MAKETRLYDLENHYNSEFDAITTRNHEAVFGKQFSDWVLPCGQNRDGTRIFASKTHHDDCHKLFSEFVDKVDRKIGGRASRVFRQLERLESDKLDRMIGKLEEFDPQYYDDGE